jgi:hypothetical protein
VTAVVDAAQCCLHVFPPTLVLQATPDEFDDKGTAPAFAGTPVKFVHQSVLNRYVQTHVHILAHSDWDYSCGRPYAVAHCPMAVRPDQRRETLSSSDEMDPVASTTAVWRAAAERNDVAAASRCLADGVVMVSPLTSAFRFRGPAEANDVLAAAFEVLSEIRFHTEVGDDRTRALFYYARCGSEPLEEAQLLRFDPDGQITELTLFVRPLPGVTAMMAAIGPKLLKRQRKPGLARVIAGATAPLAALTRLGERHLVPLTDPSRDSARD